MTHPFKIEFDKAMAEYQPLKPSEVADMWNASGQNVTKFARSIEQRCKPQPQQEPVAFLVEGFGDEGLISHQLFFKVEDAKSLASIFSQHYPTVTMTALIRTQPQRKPLTDDEIYNIGWELSCQDIKTIPEYKIAFARAIEAAHGIKG